ncbi:uncharacterized membrane protein YtjA (UPF0391 family) [Roseibium hamelinense]|uniref:UPF0391 membrane protein JM93_04347 n=2 Tax=Roseibium hamelinense TaxID=150831 RepID=A0A562SEB7_9HYPH|nr:uncharacterized membrane protein YtjA (UPF0391 family) [Roseibium hamelinense]
MELNSFMSVEELLLKQEDTMFSWALMFLVVALVAAVLGFGGIAGTAVSIAKLIFFVAIALFMVSAIMHVVRGRSA